MKDRVNQLLLGGFLLSLALCVWAWFSDIRLILLIPAFPFFCVQLLLLRMTRARFCLFFPIALDLLLAFFGAFLWLLGPGWDTLLGLILLCAAIAPAVGCLLGWLVYLLSVLHRRRNGGPSHG